MLILILIILIVIVILLILFYSKLNPTKLNPTTMIPTTMIPIFPKLVLGNTQRFLMSGENYTSNNTYSKLTNISNDDTNGTKIGQNNYFEFMNSCISNNKNTFLSYGFGNNPSGSISYYACYSTNGLYNWISVKPFETLNNLVSDGISNALFGLDNNGNDLFVVIRKNKNEIAHSSDAITWTRVDMNHIFTTIHNICWGAGSFVAIGLGLNNVLVVAYSNGATTWNTISFTGLTNLNRGIMFANDMFIIQDNSNNSIMSYDGIEWFNRSLPYHISSAGAGKYISIGNDNKMRYSSDLIIWNEIVGQFDLSYGNVDDGFDTYYLSDSLFGYVNGINYFYVRNNSFGGNSQNQYQIYSVNVDNLSIWTKVSHTQSWNGVLFPYLYLTYNT